jgi:transposase
MRRGKRFDEEFRREAVRLVEAGDRPIKQVARELGVHVETLRSWRRQYGSEAEAGTERKGSTLSLEEENRRLRREMAILKEEREILKKATAFFAKGAR